MTDSLFDEPTEVRFEDLVGPDKAYKTPEDAAKALIEKDRFIEQLKGENGTFRTELQARLSLEELAESLKVPNGEPPASNRGAPGSNKQDDPAPVDIKAEVQRLLSEERTTDKLKSNLAKAKEAAKQMYGGDYNATLRQIATELGVSDKFLNDVAASSPEAFVKLLTGVKAPDTNRPSAPPESSQDFTRQGQNPNRRNQAYYTNLRKTDLATYMSKRVQNEMHREAMLQGSKFFE